MVRRAIHARRVSIAIMAVAERMPICSASIRTGARIVEFETLRISFQPEVADVTQ